MKNIIHAYVYLTFAVLAIAQCPTKSYNRCCDVVLSSQCKSDEDCKTYVFATYGDNNPVLKCQNSKCLHLTPEYSPCSQGTGFNQGNNCSTCESLYGLEPPACIPTAVNNGDALLRTDLNSCCIIIDEGCKTSDDCKKSNIFSGSDGGVSYDCYDSTCYYVDRNLLGCTGKTSFKYCGYSETIYNRCLAVYNGITQAPGPAPASAPDVLLTSAPGPAPASAPDVLLTSAPTAKLASAPDVLLTSAPGPAPASAPDVLLTSAPTAKLASAPDAPTSAPAPDTPTTTGSPTSTTSESSVSTPAPDTPTTPTTSESSASTPLPTKEVKGGGVGCIADYQSVVTTYNTTKAIRDLKPGDIVVTDEGLQEYIGDIHEGSVLPTIVLHTASSTIEITGNHLVKTKSSKAALLGFSHASDIIVGDFIATGKVVRITYATSFVSSPLTRSGTIIVNNVVLSCYASVYSHQVAKISTYPLRIGVFKNIHSYFKFMIYIHNLLPQFVQRLITNF